MLGDGYEMNIFGANPNRHDECSRCGKPLVSKAEEEINLCKECQRRQEDHNLEDVD
ncbi:hypothetical protein [Halobacillus litoralis]|uniref:hypothetical protein n=1 Tax=Halobacillus litoralis TaxID=45668 RepID=UPI0019263A51|nr:hypothetical protein [Halobacillus litoralis]